MKKALLLGVKGPGLEVVVGRDVNLVGDFISNEYPEFEIEKKSEGLNRSSLKSAVENWCSSLTSEDQGILYISSHAENGSQGAFIHAEGYESDDSQKLTSTEFQSMIGTINSECSVEIVLDFCHAEMFWKDSLLRKGMSFWTSSKSNQKSVADADNISLFTSKLVAYFPNCQDRDQLLAVVNYDLSRRSQEGNLHKESMSNSKLFEL